MTENKTISFFLNFINSINERPGMYQVNKVEDISLIIFGYKNGLSSHSEEQNYLTLLINEFNDFVNKEFDTKGEVDWVRLIRFHGNGDKNSLELFKIKFKYFISEYYKN